MARRKIENTDPVQNGEVVGVERNDIADATPMQTTGDTVTICSNFPRDIIFNVPDARGIMQKVTINGNANYLKGAPKGIIPVGAYGITTGVPAEAWDWIMAHHCDNKLLKNGLIFSSTAVNARAAARERKDLRHGYEPVDPKKNAQTEPYKA